MPRFAILSGLTTEHRGKAQGMEQSDCIGQGRRGKHLTKDERIVIEAYDRTRDQARQCRTPRQ